MDPIIFVLPSSAPMGKNIQNIALELGRRFFVGFGFWKNETFYFFETITPWKTNMSPKNKRLEDVFPIEIVPFLETC